MNCFFGNQASRTSVINTRVKFLAINVDNLIAPDLKEYFDTKEESFHNAIGIPNIESWASNELAPSTLIAYCKNLDLLQLQSR